MTASEYAATFYEAQIKERIVTLTNLKEMRGSKLAHDGVARFVNIMAGLDPAISLDHRVKPDDDEYAGFRRNDDDYDTVMRGLTRVSAG